MRTRTALALITASVLLAVPAASSAVAASGDIYREGVTAPTVGQSSPLVDKIRFTVEPDTTRYEVLRNGVAIRSGAVVTAKRTYSQYMSITESGIKETLQYFYEVTLPRLSSTSDVYQVVVISKSKVRSKAIGITRSDFSGRFAQVGFAKGSALLSPTSKKALDRVISTAKSSELKKVTVIANHGADETAGTAAKRGEVIVAYLTARLKTVKVTLNVTTEPNSLRVEESQSAFIATSIG